MKGLELAIKTFCALAESTEEVSPSTLWCWDSVRTALEASPRGRAVIDTLESLEDDELFAVLQAAGTFEPLSPLGETYIFDSAADAKRFYDHVPAEGREMFAENVVNVHGEAVRESFTAPHGGEYVGLDDLADICNGVKAENPLMEAFAWIDTALPQDMRRAGIAWDRIAEALVMRSRRGLHEGVLGTAGPEESFTGRIARLAVPRKRIGGVDADLVAALHEQNMIPAWAARRLGLQEQDDAVRPGGEAEAGAEGGAEAERGVSNERPEDQPGSPAASKSEPSKEREEPTEVPKGEEGGTTHGEVKLSDGTTVPEPVLKQALAKLLHNLATQVEQGTTGGKPEERKPEEEPEKPEEEPEEEGPEEPKEPEAPPTPEEKPEEGEEEEKPPAPPAPAAPAAPAPKKESVAARLLRGEVSLDEVLGGASTKGAYPFRKKEQQYAQMSMDQLHFALGDAHEAAKAMQGHDPTAEAWYLDDLATIQKEINRRKTMAEGRRKKMTKADALAKLKATGQLSTGMLEPLGISMDQFLRFAQLPKKRTDEIVKKMIAHLEKGGSLSEAVDETAARELELYIDNDRELYRQRRSIEQNIARKMKSGRYDPTKAPKLWQYLIDAGARKYAKEFGGSVRDMFPKELRVWLSVQYARDHEQELGIQGGLAELAEQLDVGQEAEGEAAAKGFADAAAALKQLRQASFALTTDSLVRLESLLQSVGAKKAAKAVTKLRGQVAGFNDDVKAAAEALDKANDQFKGENGGKGGEEHQGMEGENGEAEAAPPTDNPGNQVPAGEQKPETPPPAETPPAASESVRAAVGRLAGTDIPGRILGGENYITVAEDIRLKTSDIGLTSREVAEVHEMLRLTESMARSKVFSLEMPDGDRDLLRSVSAHPRDIPARLVEALDAYGSVSVREDTVMEAVKALRQFGELRHRVLAEHLERMMSVASAGTV